MKKDHREFLQSGIIENYHLGMASEEEVDRLLALCHKYPEAQNLLDKGYQSFLYILESYAKTPPTRNLSSILNSVSSKSELIKASFVGTAQELDRFVPISAHSNVEEWNKLLAGLQPDDEYDNMFAKPLFHSDRQELTLVWAKEIVPDEIHTNQSESFFLLEGTADCYIGDKLYAMEKGDYMLIPLHVNHKVVITSMMPAKALMSRVAI